MRFSISTVVGCATTLAAAAPSTIDKRSSASGGFNWGDEVMRGVNIGGWLVLEPWITPSIFQAYPMSQGIVDEYTLCDSLGTQACLEVLRPHWESWVTLDDFKKIAASGFNVVRVPVGFWAYDNANTPYVQGAAYYIDQAINWARRTGLKVIIDLHGAPGSQNGFDNSGQKLPVPEWQTGDTVTRTLAVLNTIQTKYGSSTYDDVVAGIELLNEPLISELQGGVDETKQFFRSGFDQQRAVSSSRVVVVQDGFQQPSSYNGFLTPSDNDSQNVALDHHEYQVFNDDQVSLLPWQHRQLVCNNAETYAGADKWTFVGEWSAAMTDCAAALNGYGIGARYDGTYTGSTQAYGTCDGVNVLSEWSQAMRDDTRGYIEAQMEVFEHYTQGWVFWNFKTEGGTSPEWDAFALIDAGVFPQPLSDRQFGTICEY